MTPEKTPINWGNVFVYVVVGIVAVAFVAGTVGYLLGGQAVAATCGIAGGVAGALTGGIVGATHKFA